MRAKSIGTLVTLLSVLLFDVGETRAGFGRRSAGDNDNSGRSGSGRETVHKDRGSSHSRSSNNSSSRTYNAPSATPGRSGSSSAGRSQRRSWTRGNYSPWGYGLYYAPPVPPSAIAPGVVGTAYGPEYLDAGPAPGPPSVQLGLSGEVFGGVGGLVGGVRLQIEEQLFGLNAGFDALAFPVEDAPKFELETQVYLAHVHGTVALVALPNMRVRAELGVHFASAPEVTFVAPGFGTSLLLAFQQHFGLEGRIYGNAWPYTMLDTRLGVTWSFEEVGVGLGMRSLYLNDNGEAGEGDSDDHIWGPYLTVGLAI